MALKKVKPQDRLLVTVKRLRRELDTAIAEYETEISKGKSRNPKRVFIDNPLTGKRLYVDKNNK